MIATSRKPSVELEAVAGVERVELDLADDASISAAAEKIIAIAPRIDVLLNNAGVPHGGVWKDSENFGTLEIAAMERVIRANTLGPLVFSQKLIEPLKAAAPGSILAGVTSFFSSLGGRPDYFANNFGYSMSKVSMNMWLRTLHFILKDVGVRTVTLDPGWVKTDMGGKDAPLEPKDVCAGIIRVLENLTPEQSGSYISWEGKTVPW